MSDKINLPKEEVAEIVARAEDNVTSDIEVAEERRVMDALKNTFKTRVLVQATLDAAKRELAKIDNFTEALSETGQVPEDNWLTEYEISTQTLNEGKSYESEEECYYIYCDNDLTVKVSREIEY